MLRIQKLATALTALIVVSIVSYGATVGSASMIFSSSTTSPFVGLAGTSEFAVVQSIEAISPPPLAIGFDLGAPLAGEGMRGNQGGQCDANTTAAIAGRPIKNIMRCTDAAYRVTLRIDDGSLQTYVQQAPLHVRIGDRVLLDTDTIMY